MNHDLLSSTRPFRDEAAIRPARLGTRSRRSPRSPQSAVALREEFLTPMKLSASALAKACDVPRTRIERLIREETPALVRVV